MPGGQLTCLFCLPLYFQGPEPATHTKGSGLFMAGIHERETTVVLDTVQARRPGQSGHPNLLLKVWAWVFTRAVLDHLSPVGACSSPLTVSYLPSCCPESSPCLGLPVALAQQALQPCCLSGPWPRGPHTRQVLPEQGRRLPVPALALMEGLLLVIQVSKAMPPPPRGLP